MSTIGWSGSGKTTLVVQALEECRRRGIPAAAAKAAHHEPDVAPTGKDSTAFLGAGALASLYMGDNGAALFMPSPPAPDAAFFQSLFPDAELVFLEGLELDGAFVAQTARAGSEESKLKRPLAEVDLLVTDDPGIAASARAVGTAVLDPAEIPRLVDILEARNGTRS